MRKNRLRQSGRNLRRGETETVNEHVGGRKERKKKTEKIGSEIIESDTKMTEVCEEDSKNRSK